MEYNEFRDKMFDSIVHSARFIVANTNENDSDFDILCKFANFLNDEGISFVNYIDDVNKGNILVYEMDVKFTDKLSKDAVRNGAYCQPCIKLVEKYYENHNIEEVQIHSILDDAYDKVRIEAHNLMHNRIMKVIYDMGSHLVDINKRIAKDCGLAGYFFKF